MSREVFSGIVLHRMPEMIVKSDDLRWRADFGRHHGAGRTPGEAVDRLVKYVEALDAQKA